jgi:peptidoglycan/LPS O-acetylase OafA/YrhL
VLALQHGAPVDQSAATKAWAFAALAAAYVLAYRRKLPDFFKLLVAAPIGLAIALILQLAEIWPPPRSLLPPLLAAPVIVGAAFAIRTAVARRGRGTRSDRT